MYYAEMRYMAMRGNEACFVATRDHLSVTHDPIDFPSQPQQQQQQLYE
jgi:hypothetical protein